jgi:hypothetical protein
MISDDGLPRWQEIAFFFGLVGAIIVLWTLKAWGIV